MEMEVVVDVPQAATLSRPRGRLRPPKPDKDHHDLIHVHNHHSQQIGFGVMASECSARRVCIPFVSLLLFVSFATVLVALSFVVAHGSSVRSKRVAPSSHLPPSSAFASSSQPFPSPRSASPRPTSQPQPTAVAVKDRGNRDKVGRQSGADTAKKEKKEKHPPTALHNPVPSPSRPLAPLPNPAPAVPPRPNPAPVLDTAPQNQKPAPASRSPFLSYVFPFLTKSSSPPSAASSSSSSSSGHRGSHH